MFFQSTLTLRSVSFFCWIWTEDITEPVFSFLEAHHQAWHIALLCATHLFTAGQWWQQPEQTIVTATGIRVWQRVSYSRKHTRVSTPLRFSYLFMTQREMNDFIFFLPTVKVASCPLVMEKQAGHMPGIEREGGAFFLSTSTERRMSKAGNIKARRQIGFE